MPDNYSALRTMPFSVIASVVKADVSLFKTRKNGQEFYGPCPVHKPKNNHTSFSYHSSGKFQCFSCGAKGSGAIDLVKLAQGIGFQQAVELLEGLKVPQTQKTPRVGRSNDDGRVDSKDDNTPGEGRPDGSASQSGATSEPASSSSLTPFTGQYHKFAVPCPWLEQRVPDAGIRQKYGLFCYDNPSRPKSSYRGRVMVPIKDLDGQLFGYLGRYIGDNAEADHDAAKNSIPAKYLWPPSLPKSRFLFGAHELLEEAPVKVCFLVESPFAVLKFVSMGLACVAAYGWSVSPEQIELLVQIARAIVYLPDRNKYDQTAQCLALLTRRIWTYCPELPEGIDDPEQLTKLQALALL